MGKRQQVKGKEFEKKAARIIGSSLGISVVRNPNQSGEDSGRDLLTKLRFCIQCQHAKRIDPWQKLQEALDSAREGELSVAVLRKDYKKIIVAMTLDEWLLLAKAALRNAK